MDRNVPLEEQKCIKQVYDEVKQLTNVFK